MTNPYRAMCAELLAAFEIQLDELRFNDRLCVRARALLDQPAPPELTDEELDDIIIAVALPGLDRDSGVRLVSTYERRLMRAAIAADRARWGNATPQPPAEGES